VPIIIDGVTITDVIMDGVDIQNVVMDGVTIFYKSGASYTWSEYYRTSSVIVIQIKIIGASVPPTEQIGMSVKYDFVDDYGSNLVGTIAFNQTASGTFQGYSYTIGYDFDVFNDSIAIRLNTNYASNLSTEVISVTGLI
jgi:hypothetical protein